MGYRIILEHFRKHRTKNYNTMKTGKQGGSLEFCMQCQIIKVNLLFGKLDYFQLMKATDIAKQNVSLGIVKFVKNKI